MFANAPRHRQFHRRTLCKILRVALWEYNRDMESMHFKIAVRLFVEHTVVNLEGEHKAVADPMAVLIVQNSLDVLVAHYFCSVAINASASMIHVCIAMSQCKRWFFDVDHPTKQSNRNTLLRNSRLPLEITCGRVRKQNGNKRWTVPSKSHNEAW